MSAGVGAGIRRFHRWVSMAFTLTVIANFGVRGMGSGPPPDWLTYAPLPPLALLLITGLCLFVQPYLRRPAVPCAAGAEDMRPG